MASYPCFCFHLCWGLGGYFQCFFFSRNIGQVTLKYYLFSLSKSIFPESKYPKHVWFNYENRSAGYFDPEMICLATENKNIFVVTCSEAYSKIVFVFLGYFDPINILFRNTNKKKSRWPKRCFGENGNTGDLIDISAKTNPLPVTCCEIESASQIVNPDREPRCRNPDLKWIFIKKWMKCLWNTLILCRYNLCIHVGSINSYWVTKR